jgi:hypothetical protein
MIFRCLSKMPPTSAIQSSCLCPGRFQWSCVTISIGTRASLSSLGHRLDPEFRYNRHFQGLKSQETTIILTRIEPKNRTFFYRYSIEYGSVLYKIIFHPDLVWYSKPSVKLFGLSRSSSSPCTSFDCVSRRVPDPLWFQDGGFGLDPAFYFIVDLDPGSGGRTYAFGSQSGLPSHKK